MALTPENADRVARALRDFGFCQADAAAFMVPGRVIRMGVPPLRLEILTSISGVDFPECYVRRLKTDWDGEAVNLIRLDDLRRNKKAS